MLKQSVRSDLRYVDVGDTLRELEQIDASHCVCDVVINLYLRKAKISGGHCRMFHQGFHVPAYQEL